jgi:hypothetical protein
VDKPDCVDKPDPEANCSEKDESNEALDEFLVTRGDAAQNGRINPLRAVRCALRVASPEAASPGWTTTSVMER